MIEILVFGQNIRIRHEDEEYVRGLQEFIHRKVELIQNNQKASSTINLAARTVITLGDEYLTLLKEREEATRKIEEKAKKLIEFIDAKRLL